MDMKLTEDQMWAAHFARCLHENPDFSDLDESEKARAWARSYSYHADSKSEQDKAAAEYETGLAVLGEYILTYSDQYATEAGRDRVGEDVVGYIEITSGYVATTQMYRMAMFTAK